MNLQQTQKLQIPQTYETFIYNSPLEKLQAEIISLERCFYSSESQEIQLLTAKLHFVKTVLGAQIEMRQIVQKLLEK